MSRSCSVVFIGSEKSVFVGRTADELRKRGVLVSVIDPYGDSDVGPGSLARSLVGAVGNAIRLKRKLRALPRHDAVIIHSLGRGLLFQIHLARGAAARVIGLAYGSDILRRNRRYDPLLGAGLTRLTVVAATNSNVIQEIERAFPGLADRRVLRFGLPVLEAIDGLEDRDQDVAGFRRAAVLPAGKTLVSLGYSAAPGQRQLELVDFFGARHAVLEHLAFVVPVQYGSRDMPAKVIAACDRYNASAGRPLFTPITEFYDSHQSALLRMSTDILINHSISDAFSGTVQEVLYCGNCVLAADVLPYGDMPGSEAGILSYDRLETALPWLEPQHIVAWKGRAAARLAETKREIAATSSWNAVIQDWIGVISGGQPPAGSG